MQSVDIVRLRESGELVFDEVVRGCAWRAFYGGGLEAFPGMSRSSHAEGRRQRQEVVPVEDGC